MSEKKPRKLKRNDDCPSVGGRFQHSLCGDLVFQVCHAKQSTGACDGCAFSRASELCGEAPLCTRGGSRFTFKPVFNGGRQIRATDDRYGG